MILTPEAEKSLLEWGVFQYALKEGASDLHFCVGSPVMVRLHGRLERMNTPPLTADDLGNLLQILTERIIRSQFYSERAQDLDYTVELPSLKRRFRLNVFKQYHGTSIVMRVLADRIRTFEELGVPRSFEKQAFQKAGLVLVTGGTGSGKSTTLCAMIEMINKREQRHVITIEDPIEIIFENQRSLIEQREIPTHVPDFHTALRSALREAPDVILVGEIRDSETAEMALKAAQIGALVMATMHTRSAGETIGRYISMFDDSHRVGARSQMADVLRAVLCQNLILTRDQKRRVAACEILIGTNAVKHLVRDDRTHLLHSCMEIAGNDGMITMEQSLVNLYNEGQIDLQTAFDHCNEKQSFLAQLPPELQKELQIDWETEVDMRNLEKQREARARALSVRTV